MPPASIVDRVEAVLGQFDNSPIHWLPHQPHIKSLVDRGKGADQQRSHDHADGRSA
jgi:hypothetical protein